MEMARTHRLERFEHNLPHTGLPRFPIVEHGLHGLPLQSILAAAEIAGNDWEGHGLGEFGEIFFRASDERPEHKDIALIVQELWRHGR